MIDEFLKMLCEAIFAGIGHCAILARDAMNNLFLYILYHPNPQILYYRLFGAMILFMIVTFLFSIYMSRRRRRLNRSKKDEQHKFYDEDGRTIIITGGNNQIGNENRQNNHNYKNSEI